MPEIFAASVLSVTPPDGAAANTDAEKARPTASAVNFKRAGVLRENCAIGEEGLFMNFSVS